ncbi:MAG: polysaccharide biosynthesis tyrosine autokinase [Pirellulaceae bacterium]
MIRSTKPEGTTESAPQPADDELSILNVWQVFSRRWGLLLVCVSIGWGAAVAYWKFTPPTYESSIQLMVMRKNSNVTTTGAQQNNELDSNSSEDVLATHMQIIQSKRNVSEALAQNGLDQLPSIQEAMGENGTPTGYVIDQLQVTRGGDGQAKSAHVLNIAFRHSSPVDAQRVVEAVTDSYREFLQEQYQDSNKEAVNLIARARGDLEAELRDAEKAYVAARENTPLLWNGEESTNIHRTRYEELQSELSAIKLKSAEARAQLETVRAQIEQLDESNAGALERLALIDADSLARVGVFADIHQGKANTAVQIESANRQAGAQAEYSQLMALVAKEKTLSKEFSSNHPTLSSVRDQIESMKGFIREREAKVSEGTGGKEADVLDPDQLLASYVRLLESSLSTLTSRERELEQVAAQEEKLAKSLVSYELEDRTLRQQIERKRELYDTVVERLSEMNLAGEYGGFINEIIAPAQPGKMVWPRLTLCLALGMFLGLMLGGGTAVLAEFRDRSFHSPEDVMQTLGLPLLAQIPDLRSSKKARIDGAAMAADIRTFHRPQSREAEVFRSLRTSLFMTAQRDGIQVIACTSPNQGDGKSTLIGNLAVSIAQSGRRVLVVDCDLRRPRAHTVFGVDNSIGLTDVLTGSAEPWDTVQATETDKLWVLPCGSVPGDPAELLESAAFREFLALAREHYDFVLLDTSPVLAVSDPCIVAPQADGVVLMIRVSRDSRPQAVKSVDMLAGIEANVIGTVINGWDASREFRYGEYGYYYTRGGKNGYYRDDAPPAPKASSNGKPAANGKAIANGKTVANGKAAATPKSEREANLQPVEASETKEGRHV